MASRTAFLVISLNRTRWMLPLRRPDLLGDVPGDGLPFAIRVGRQQNLLGPLRRRLDLRDDLLLGVDDHVDGLEVVLDVDADGRLGQILDVADRRLHLDIPDPSTS